ncbi:MAG: glycosyltransferase [Saprospiraceae bacterium]|nr:glycosyltransferase [Saprospiraceae bacterium]
MRILILNVQYYPVVNPNVYRWGAIAEYWVEQGHEVHIVCSKRTGLPKSSIINKVHVHRTGHSTLLDFTLNLFRIINRRGISDLTPKKGSGFLRNFLERIIDGTWRKLYWPDGSCPWYFPAKKKAIALHRVHNFDGIITVGLPFTAHLVGLAFKKRFPLVHWHMDIEDPFCFSKEFFVNNFRLYDKLNHQVERKAFQKADTISLTVQSAREQYEALFPESKDKISIIPPLFNLPEASEKTEWFDQDKIHLAYFGSFYENVRSPLSLLLIIKQLVQKNSTIFSTFHFHIFGEIDPKTKMVFEGYPELSSLLTFHGLIDRSKVGSAMKQADFLINIGNTTPYHLPSKSVDYLMSGKPIINICQNQNDTFKFFLKDYPLIVNIEGWKEDYETASNTMFDFIRKNKGRKVEAGFLNECIVPHKTESIAQNYFNLIAKERG